MLYNKNFQILVAVLLLLIFFVILGFVIANNNNNNNNSGDDSSSDECHTKSIDTGDCTKSTKECEHSSSVTEKCKNHKKF